MGVVRNYSTLQLPVSFVLLNKTKIIFHRDGDDFKFNKTDHLSTLAFCQT